LPYPPEPLKFWAIYEIPSYYIDPFVIENDKIVYRIT